MSNAQNKKVNDPENNEIPEDDNLPEDNSSEPDQDSIPAYEGAPAGPEANAEIDQMRDQMLRALADAENTRRRAQKDREEASKYAIAGFARSLLAVADNLRRALDSVPEDMDDDDIRVKNLVEGVEATERELLKALESHGVSKLSPMGEVFNPNYHEVMFEAPKTGKPAGTVIEVVEAGYLLKDRLLRPARVGVAKDDGSAPPAEDPSSEPGGHIDTEA